MKQEVLRPLNDRLSTALGLSTYCLVERSSFYDEQVAKQVAQWASRLQVEMKKKTFDPTDLILIIRFLHELNMGVIITVYMKELRCSCSCTF